MLKYSILHQSSKGSILLVKLLRIVVKFWLKSFTFSFFSIFKATSSLNEVARFFSSPKFMIKDFSKSFQQVMDLDDRLKYHVEALFSKV
jgi:hypothetical protein